jgi:hypothetical protein
MNLSITCFNLARVSLRSDLTTCDHPGKRNELPQGGKKDQNIDDAGENRALATKECCHKVNLQQADRTPVDASDDKDDQREYIHCSHLNLQGVELNPRRTNIDILRSDWTSICHKTYATAANPVFGVMQ